MQRYRVRTDPDPYDPREDATLGIMACWHRSYRLGDEQPDVEPVAYRAALEENHGGWLVILPLYLMDHSGLSMSTGSYGDPWDSGQVGWISATPARIAELGAPTDPASALRQLESVADQLRAEVAEYDLYLRGACYGFELDDGERCVACGAESWRPTESCWGFLSDDPARLADRLQEFAPDVPRAVIEEAIACIDTWILVPAPAPAPAPAPDNATVAHLAEELADVLDTEPGDTDAIMQVGDALANIGVEDTARALAVLARLFVTHLGWTDQIRMADRLAADIADPVDFARTWPPAPLR